MTQQISKLQEQVETLFANLNTLRADFSNSQPQIDPSLQQHSLSSHRTSHSSVQYAPHMPPLPRPRARSPTQPQQPTFRGPTSVEFNMGVAKHSLQSMGITHNEDSHGEVTADVTPAPSPPPNVPLHPSKDPIWHVSREEALRLVRLFEADMHEMYPTISIPQLVAHTTSLYDWMEAALRNGFVQTAQPGADAIDDEDTNILKLTMAIAMMVEGSGLSELGKKLYHSVQPAVDALLLGHAGFKGIRMLSLAVCPSLSQSSFGLAFPLILLPCILPMFD